MEPNPDETPAEKLARHRIAEQVLTKEHSRAYAASMAILDVTYELSEHLSPFLKRKLDEIQKRESNKSDQAYKQLMASFEEHRKLNALVFPAHISSPLNPLDADDPSRIQSPYVLSE